MMNLTREKTGNTQVLEISGSLTAPWSADLKKEIQAGFNESSALQLVIGKVKELDLSFIQTIAAALKTAQIDDKELKVELPVPDLLVENVILAGLQNHGICQSENCLWCDIKNQNSGA